MSRFAGLRVPWLLFTAVAVACGGPSSRAPAASYELATEGAGGTSPSGGHGGASGGHAGDGGAAACGPVALDPAGGGGVGAAAATTVSMSSMTTSEHEPHLARAASGAIAVVWMGYATNVATSIGYVISADGGATWPAPQELASPSGNRSADPSVVADACGGFHVTWLGYAQNGTDAPTATHVYVASAPAGATTFGPPTLVSGASAEDADKPWITITPRGALLACWTSSGGVTCARSEDAAAWTASKVVASGGDIELPFVCASPEDPRVYVTYMTLGGPRLSWSDDDGTSWPASATRAVSTPSETHVGVLDPPSCVVAAGELVVSYGVSTDPMPVATSPRLSAIRFARSTDRGGSFSSYGTLEDPEQYFLHPMLARGGDGTLHLVAYRGVADGDVGGSFSYARALPGTLAFSPPTPLVGLAFVTSRGAFAWPGDYAGLVTHGGALWAAYAGSTAVGPAHVGVFGGAPPLFIVRPRRARSL